MPSEVSMSGANQVRRRTQGELERELAEAREQQAATAQILAAISNSPTDPHRVFAEIAASAARLCDAHNSGILQLAGDHLRLLARYGPLVGPAPVGQASVPFTRGAVMVVLSWTSNQFTLLTCRPKRMSTRKAVNLPGDTVTAPFS